VPIGIDCTGVTSLSKNEARIELQREFKIDMLEEVILLTVGRLVKRKGVDWFVRNVMPKLPKEYIYLIVGGGGEVKGVRELLFSNQSERERILQSIKEYNMQDRVFVLGMVNDEHKNAVISACDIFVMPNIPIEGDMEGFGIVALEAGLHGVPVVASNLEGVSDAVIGGETGLLVPHSDPEAFREAIHTVRDYDSESIIDSVQRMYSWDPVIKQYEQILMSVM
jgi:glycosyltransferase involved in cell wall biosynthesis